THDPPSDGGHQGPSYLCVPSLHYFDPCRARQAGRQAGRCEATRLLFTRRADFTAVDGGARSLDRKIMPWVQAAPQQQHLVIRLLPSRQNVLRQNNCRPSERLLLSVEVGDRQPVS
ncbi:unnamed protein product, partial [Scytosiphon promiscuus]